MTDALNKQEEYLKRYCQEQGHEVAEIFKEQASGNCRPGKLLQVAMKMINQLFLRLITRKYEIVVVRHMKDITNDLSDLKEFIKDVIAIKVGFFELSTMQFRYDTYLDDNCEKEKIVWDGGAGC